MGAGCCRYSSCAVVLALMLLCDLCHVKEEVNTQKYFIKGYEVLDVDCTHSKS